jgi:hypothetical protein
MATPKLMQLEAAAARELSDLGSTSRDMDATI